MATVELRHLRKGDPEPQPHDGVIRIYANRFCPFAHRAILVLETKKIKYQLVNVHLQDKPEWIFKKNPSGKVPILELIDGRLLDESLIVAEYLDEAFPENPLYPKDPYVKANDKLFIERFCSTVFKPLFGMVFDNTNITREQFEELCAALEPTEKELAHRNTPFLGGSSPKMIDLMIWPAVERIGILEAASPTICNVPKDKFPKFSAWKENMLQDEVVKKNYLPGKIHLAVFPFEKNGVCDYDILL